ncbi:MAG: T9SS type A sorting domain-containing protein [candidate division WOR-3 bacterium]
MIGIALFLLSVQPGKPWGYTPLSPEDASWNVELVGWLDSVGVEIGSMVAHENGKVVYMSVRMSGDTSAILVLDISDPTNPYIYKEIRNDSLRRAGIAGRTGNYLHVWWRDYFGPNKFVYVWDAYDISDPLEPVYVKTIWTYVGGWEKQPGNMFWGGGWVRDTILYGKDEYKAFNITDPLNPILLGSVNAGGGYCSTFFYPYAYSAHPRDTSGFFFFEIVDISDPTNMFLVKTDTLWAPFAQYPMAIGAWQSPEGRIYVYMAGLSGYAWSLDVTDPHHPVVLHWGMRDEQIVYGGITRGSRFYGFGYENNLVVYSLEDPYWVPVIGRYRCDSIDYTDGGTWANGYIVAKGRPYPFDTFDLIAIFHYIGDTIPEDTSDTTEHYLEWVRTIYTGPELSFSISQQARVSFSLFNISGQKAYERDLGTLAPGPHTISLPGLKPGVYFLHLRINNKLIEKKIIFTQEGGFYRDDNPIRPANKGSKETKRRL